MAKIREKIYDTLRVIKQVITRNHRYIYTTTHTVVVV